MKTRLAVGAFLFCLTRSAVAAEAEATSLALPNHLSSFNRIRVAVVQNGDEVTLSANGAYRVESLPDRSLLDRGLRLGEMKVRPSFQGIRFGAKDFRFPKISILSDSGSIRVNNKIYSSGVQIFRKSRGRLLVVNEVEAETYLKGVLPSEMPPRWPKEALKAQAVASRTFALFKALSKKNEDYMVAGDVIGQVYGGHGAEHSATDRLIDETRGEILTYQGQIFPAYFHSTCAGQTTHAEYNWDIQPHPALQGVNCFFCLRSKYQRWGKEVQINDLERRLKNAGYQVGAISRISPGKWDASGRAREIEVRHSKGTLTLRGNDFRLAVGPHVVRSLKDLRVARSGSSMKFAGRGWGHGVGMCQWGAKALAEQGKTYREILEFYYPGATITRIR